MIIPHLISSNLILRVDDQISMMAQHGHMPEFSQSAFIRDLVELIGTVVGFIVVFGITTSRNRGAKNNDGKWRGDQM